jgi:hypothetical protein
MTVCRIFKSAAGRGPTVKQIQLLHVIPARLGWGDEERRSFIAARTGGKRSAKDLTHREATLLIDLLMAMQEGRPVPTFRTDGGTRAELDLAASLRRQFGEPRFDGLARRIAGRADLAAAPGRKVRAVIQAAKAIMAREAK